MTGVPPQLLPLCTVDLELAEPLRLGRTPAGERIVVDITGMTIRGERLSADLVGRAAADWLTISAGVAYVDVRATVLTTDGALVHIRYAGRSDAAEGMGTRPVYVAATFETASPEHRWLNAVQAVGRGHLADRRYEWFTIA